MREKNWPDDIVPMFTSCLISFMPSEIMDDHLMFLWFPYNSVSHSLPASMALARPMSISWRSDRIDPSKPASVELPSSLLTWQGCRKKVSERFQHLRSAKFDTSRKKKPSKPVNPDPSVHGTRCASITLAKTSKHQDMNRFGEYDTKKQKRRFVTCKIQLKQGPSEDGCSKE